MPSFPCFKWHLRGGFLGTLGNLASIIIPAATNVIESEYGTKNIADIKFLFFPQAFLSLFYIWRKCGDVK